MNCPARATISSATIPRSGARTFPPMPKSGMRVCTRESTSSTTAIKVSSSMTLSWRLAPIRASSRSRLKGRERSTSTRAASWCWASRVAKYGSTNPWSTRKSAGVKQEVAGRYVMKGTRQVGFRVAAYDPSRPLIIDPVLVYSTYLGGSDNDAGRGIAVDGAGSAYVTGDTASTDFPTTAGAAQTTHAGVRRLCDQAGRDRIRAGLFDLPGRQPPDPASTSPWTTRAAPT